MDKMVVTSWLQNAGSEINKKNQGLFVHLSGDPFKWIGASYSEA